eukprot:GHVU01138879.1.p1 GENE.GHVU01138879.1~~GHVU01138879.1.p1  ORF type:complete len:175 (+),score=33.40 GHVU01138879.1:148-672(+)
MGEMLRRHFPSGGLLLPSSSFSSPPRRSGSSCHRFASANDMLRPLHELIRAACAAAPSALLGCSVLGHKGLHERLLAWWKAVTEFLYKQEPRSRQWVYGPHECRPVAAASSSSRDEEEEEEEECDAVRSYRYEGRHRLFVVTADMRNCFDFIPHADLDRTLSNAPFPDATLTVK